MNPIIYVCVDAEIAKRLRKKEIVESPYSLDHIVFADGLKNSDWQKTDHVRTKEKIPNRVDYYRNVVIGSLVKPNSYEIIKNNLGGERYLSYELSDEEMNQGYVLNKEKLDNLLIPAHQLISLTRFFFGTMLVFKRSPYQFPDIRIMDYFRSAKPINEVKSDEELKKYDVVINNGKLDPKLISWL